MPRNKTPVSLPDFSLASFELQEYLSRITLYKQRARYSFSYSALQKMGHIAASDGSVKPCIQAFQEKAGFVKQMDN